MDTEITELDELSATKVSGVASPANGTSWLVLKAQEAEKESAEHVHDTDTDSPEAAEFMAEVTKAAMMGFCGTDCELCDKTFGAIAKILKAKLSAADRHALPDSEFAIPESHSYPINDANHARNALSRVSENGTPEEKAKVRSAVHSKYPEMGAEKEADEPLEKSPGVPDESVAEPHEGGHIEGSGKSGLTGPATGDLAEAVTPSQSEGGRSSYLLPAESKAFIVSRPMAGPTEIQKEDWTIEVVGKGNWMAIDNPLGGNDVGGPAWEAYDSATLDKAARGLAAASSMVNDIAKREATEAINGNAAEWLDTYQLGCALDDMNHALCLVAGLAYHEAAAVTGAATKAGARHSASTLATLRAARDHLTDLLGDGANPAGRPGTEEDQIMATVTKEELDAHIAEVATSAALAAVKADRKARKEEKAAAEAAAKNANNGGDITEDDMRSKVAGHVDSNDIGAIGHGDSMGGGVTKEEEPSMADLLKTVSEMQDTLEKMGSRPRQGGPVLDGVARGSFPAAEGRMSETATKSAEDLRIDDLEEQFTKAKEARGPEAAARADHLGQELTLERIKKARAAGLI